MEGYQQAEAVRGAGLGESVLEKVVKAFMSFYNLRRTQAPIYLFDEIPFERPVAYNVRHQHEYKPMPARIVCFSNT